MFCRREHFPELCEETSKKGQKHPVVDFVDVGCGFGGLTVRLADAFPKKVIVGMEIRKKVSGQLWSSLYFFQ